MELPDVTTDLSTNYHIKNDFQMNNVFWITGTFCLILILFAIGFLVEFGIKKKSAGTRERMLMNEEDIIENQRNGAIDGDKIEMNDSIELHQYFAPHDVEEYCVVPIVELPNNPKSQNRHQNSTVPYSVVPVIERRDILKDVEDGQPNSVVPPLVPSNDSMANPYNSLTKNWMEYTHTYSSC